MRWSGSLRPRFFCAAVLGPFAFCFPFDFLLGRGASSDGEPCLPRLLPVAVGDDGPACALGCEPERRREEDMENDLCSKREGDKTKRQHVQQRVDQFWASGTLIP